jgi:hypothetical protein
MHAKLIFFFASVIACMLIPQVIQFQPENTRSILNTLFFRSSQIALSSLKLNGSWLPVALLDLVANNVRRSFKFDYHKRSDYFGEFSRL